MLWGMEPYERVKNADSGEDRNVDLLLGGVELIYSAYTDVCLCVHSNSKLLEIFGGGYQKARRFGEEEMPVDCSCGCAVALTVGISID
jgi:hypothetical protein